MLPVFLLNETRSVPPPAPEQECGIVVLRVRDREIGLVAALPIQVIEMKPDFDRTVLRQPGIAGSKVWNRNTILFVDIWEILQRRRPELLDFELETAGRVGQWPEIVVVEPVEFFQKQVRLQLENHGFQVVTARSWEEVEALLAVPRPRLAALMADLPTLREDGFAGIRGLRSRRRLNGTPVAALHLTGFENNEELAVEGIDLVFQKLENQHLPAWLESLKARPAAEMMRSVGDDPTRMPCPFREEKP